MYADEEAPLLEKADLNATIQCCDQVLLSLLPSRCSPRCSHAAAAPPQRRSCRKGVLVAGAVLQLRGREDVIYCDSGVRTSAGMLAVTLIVIAVGRCCSCFERPPPPHIFSSSLVRRVRRVRGCGGGGTDARLREQHVHVAVPVARVRHDVGGTADGAHAIRHFCGRCPASSHATHSLRAIRPTVTVTSPSPSPVRLVCLVARMLRH